MERSEPDIPPTFPFLKNFEEDLSPMSRRNLVFLQKNNLVRDIREDKVESVMKMYDWSEAGRVRTCILWLNDDLVAMKYGKFRGLYLSRE